jgi:hypothetical protein
MEKRKEHEEKCKNMQQGANKGRGGKKKGEEGGGRDGGEGN